MEEASRGFSNLAPGGVIKVTECGQMTSSGHECCG
jgi:hypothetical protein